MEPAGTDVQEHLIESHFDNVNPPDSDAFAADENDWRSDQHDKNDDPDLGDTD